MRLNNRNKVAFYHFLSTFVIILFIVGVALFFIERYLYHYLGWLSVFLIIIPSFMLMIFYLRGRQIFEYDSDGEALNFKNRNVILFLDKAANDEFPKYKLKNYEVINAVIFRKLFITISSKKSNSIILKYDISYLTKKELNDLKFSLSKVVKKNLETDNN